MKKMVSLIEKDIKNAVFNCLFHGTFFCLFTYAYLKETSKEMEERYEKHGFTGHLTYGGRYKFATFIDLHMQIIYYFSTTISSLYELMTITAKDTSLGKVQANNKLNIFCNWWYIGFSYPFSFFVTTQFWGIYLVDKKMIFSEQHEKVIPSHLNHIVHTLPLISTVLDSYLYKHQYNKSFMIGCLPSFFYSVSYVIWIFIVYNYAGFWIYPFLGHMSPFIRYTFITLVFLSNFATYKSGELLNRFFWRHSQQEKIKSQ